MQRVIRRSLCREGPDHPDGGEDGFEPSDHGGEPNPPSVRLNMPQNPMSDYAMRFSLTTGADENSLPRPPAAWRPRRAIPWPTLGPGPQIRGPGQPRREDCQAHAEGDTFHIASNDTRTALAAAKKLSARRGSQDRIRHIEGSQQ